MAQNAEKSTLAGTLSYNPVDCLQWMFNGLLWHGSEGHGRSCQLFVVTQVAQKHPIGHHVSEQMSQWYTCAATSQNAADLRMNFTGRPNGKSVTELAD